MRQGHKSSSIKLAFHDADTDILARILFLADTSNTRDFLKLFLCRLTTRRHSRDDPRDDVGQDVGVGVGVVECQLNQTAASENSSVHAMYVGGVGQNQRFSFFSTNNSL